MKLLKNGKYSFRLYMRQLEVQEYLLIDLLSGDEEYAVAWRPGKAQSRKYIFTLRVRGDGLVTIKKTIEKTRPRLGDYHDQVDELAKQINKARLAFSKVE